MKITDEIKFYYSSKVKCPKCLSRDIADTQINVLDLPEGQYRDRSNKTQCLNCGWHGVIDDLKR